MKNLVKFLSSFLLIVLLFNSIYACGPSYLSPIFEYEHAPDDPFANFAAGKIGILKPTYRRVVLVAAYRYLNGGGFSQDEQKALVDVWNAEFNNKSFTEDDISETVKGWVEKRKSVVGKEAKTPEIYVEREYGGYDFFPNCTKNAFETATVTLADRITSHGSDDKDVKDWITAQDKVFENCASGKSTPVAPNEAMSEWLQKDRAYQLAAAEFYSLDYAGAKRRFEEIAQDYKSPWQETAEYLVGRTLLRQASLSKDPEKSKSFYIEAEQNLSLVATKSGKFADSAEKMLGLIKYRLRPQERVRELAQTVATQGGNNFRQDLIDYNWLLDKFEKESLEAEDKRKEAIKQTNANSNTISPGNDTNSNKIDNSNQTVEPPHDEGDLKITVYSEDYSQNWTFFIKPDATDDEAIAKAQATIGQTLNDKMKENVRNARKTAYLGRYEQNGSGDYQGGYYGEEPMSLSVLPDYLRLDDLTNWLFTFQIQGNEAYLYALSQYRQTKSDLWLLTAISKAEIASTELNRLLEAADKIDRSAPAYPTIAYHKARILMAQGKPAEARKLLDDVLNSTIELPISSRNQFLAQRTKLADTLEDYLKFAQRKPFAFDIDGESGTIDQFIAEQKSYYDPKNDTQTREEFDKEVEDRFAAEKPWQDRTMFDSETINVMNQHFPLTVMLEAEKSPALPDYLHERFAIAIWTRAVLLDDFKTANKIAPEVVEFHLELKDLMDKIFLAKTPLAQKRAALFLILKNPMVSPYLEDGLEKSDNVFDNFDSNDWWCAPYDTEYDETGTQEIPKKLPPKPLFLTEIQSNAAQAERKKLKEIGDAPKFMGEKVLEWARLSPTDKRIPESLYQVYEANGWTKYGCGSNEELRNQIGAILKKKYPQSEWTRKILDEEKEQNS
jgi:hypothetical protein